MTQQQMSNVVEVTERKRPRHMHRVLRERVRHAYRPPERPAP